MNKDKSGSKIKNVIHYVIISGLFIIILISIMSENQIVGSGKKPTSTVFLTSFPTASPFPMATVQPLVDLNSKMADLVEDLPFGKALFNPPEEMKVGETKRVEVRIIPVPPQYQQRKRKS